MSVSLLLSPLGWSDSLEEDHVIIFLQDTSLAANLLGTSGKRGLGERTVSIGL